MAGDSLGSAPVPAVGAEDRVRGPAAGPLVIAYSDFECPYCARLAASLDEAGARVCFRHFPVRSKHPRAWPAALAAEAAGAQDAFWTMHDALFADQGRLEDPHLWRRAEALGLDLQRFEADRRADGASERVRAQMRAGVRAGVAATPTFFHGGRAHTERDPDALRALLAAAQ